MKGRIPRQFIDDLIGRADIVPIVDARVPLKRRGKEYVACCPFHTENTPSFSVSPAKQFYHCFGCGAHGTVIDFMMQYERLEFPDAVESLAAELGMEVPREEYETGNRKRTPYDVLHAAAEFYRQQLKDSPRAIEYLKSRGLSGRTAAAYGIGYAPGGWHTLQGLTGTGERELIDAGLLVRRDDGQTYDRFRDRIMFPIRDRRGRVIAFGGRILDQGQPKYLNSPESSAFDKGSTLYGLYDVLQADAKPTSLLIVEGYMDVVTLAQYGVRNAVAALGTAATQAHLLQALRIAPQIVFCFDGDRAGREAAWRAVTPLMSIFRDGQEARFLILPEGEDPDSAIRVEGAEAFRKRIETAPPLSTFLFERLAEGIGGDSVADSAKLAERATPLLKRLPDGVFKRLMYEQLSQRVGVTITPDRPAPGRRRETAKTQDGVVPPLDKALKLLLHKPSVAAGLSDLGELEDLDLPGMPLFLKVVDFARVNPHSSGISLVEHFRDSEDHQQLLDFVKWQAPPDPGFNTDAEMRDRVEHLRKLRREARAGELIREAKQRALTDAEKRELSDLVAATTG